MKEILQKVCEEFRIKGKFVSYDELKVGNINRTYKVDYVREDGEPKSYIVQRINTNVFKEPVKVMENIDYVTEYIRDQAPDKKVLHFHHTKDRKTFVLEGDGFWRLFNYFPSTTYNLTDNPEVVKNAGKAFGEFQMLLSDFDASLLHVTIPDFHNTRRRYEKLEADVQADPFGKAAEVRKEIDYLLSVKDKACTLTDLLDKGELPLRVTHNDTKINNVLFEKDGGTRALVVIDLDTVMPGLVGHDFGDAIRSAANFVDEDSPHAADAGVSLDMFRAFAKGFLKRTARVLTEKEVQTLALSCFVLAAEQSVRFLDDYIMGSTYFKINYPEHNLVRTRCQVALARDMEKKMPEMEAIVRYYADKYRNKV